MMVAIAYSHFDIVQALRLVKWMGFLSSRQGNSLLQESVLLVPNQIASRNKRHGQILWIARHIFGEARCHVPETEHEVGWPGSANWMLKQVLTHVDEHFGHDVFFMEPDGVPVVPDWLDRIKGEWNVAKAMGKTFMGAKVPHNVEHLTGIAVYGRNWRQVAPMLLDCPDIEAWDTYAAPQIMPNAHFTPLIQHVFRRHDPRWAVPGLSILDKRAVIFHQDKKGELIRFIDEETYGGACSRHPFFSYNPPLNSNVMAKFYYIANATKSRRAHGKVFAFDPLPNFGGSIPGILAVDNPDDQAALDSLVADPTSGITEISKEEWEASAKKKWDQKPSPTSAASNANLRQDPILATKSKSPAVLVEEPTTPPSNVPVARSAVATDEQVGRTATVEPAQKEAVKTADARPRATTVAKPATSATAPSRPPAPAHAPAKPPAEPK